MHVPYDAFLLVSFGGPEAPEQVIPFLERVTAGRNIPRERLELVGEHYFSRGGVSPLNDCCRAMLGSVGDAFEASGIDLPLYWGNRNAAPFLDDAVAQMVDDGRRRALAFVTSAYGSYSGCRQYREDIEAARAKAGPAAPQIDKLRLFYNHPGFVGPQVDAVAAAAAVAGPEAHVIFTAHSIPVSMAATSAYADQVRETARLVAQGAQLAVDRWSVAWQSRSGPPSVPWLEPDVNDEISLIADRGADHVIVVPVGFVSDHMEVIQDLDTEAAATAASRGLGFTRIPTAGTDPRFIDMIGELVRERTDGLEPRFLGGHGLTEDQCSETCCPPARRPADRPG